VVRRPSIAVYAECPAEDEGARRYRNARMPGALRGVPLSIVCGIVAIASIPEVFPF